MGEAPVINALKLSGDPLPGPPGNRENSQTEKADPEQKRRWESPQDSTPDRRGTWRRDDSLSTDIEALKTKQGNAGRSKPTLEASGFVDSQSGLEVVHGRSDASSQRSLH